MAGRTMSNTPMEYCESGLKKRMFCPLGPTDASPSRRLRYRDGHQAACLTASLMVNANVNQHNSQQPIHVLNHASSFKIKWFLIGIARAVEVSNQRHRKLPYEAPCLVLSSNACNSKKAISKCSSNFHHDLGLPSSGWRLL